MNPALKAASLAATTLAVILAGCAAPEPLEPRAPDTTGGTAQTGAFGDGNATDTNTTGTDTDTGTPTRDVATPFQGTVGVSDGVATNDPANFSQEVQVEAGAAAVQVRVEVTGNGSAEFRLHDPFGQVVWSQSTSATSEVQVLETVNGGALVSRTGPWSIQVTATQGWATFNGSVTVRYAS